MRFKRIEATDVPAKVTALGYDWEKDYIVDGPATHYGCFDDLHALVFPSSSCPGGCLILAVSEDEMERLSPCEYYIESEMTIERLEKEGLPTRRTLL